MGDFWAFAELCKERYSINIFGMIIECLRNITK